MVWKRTSRVCIVKAWLALVAHKLKFECMNMFHFRDNAKHRRLLYDDGEDNSKICKTIQKDFISLKLDASTSFRDAQQRCGYLSKIERPFPGKGTLLIENFRSSSFESFASLRSS
jgi:hypothetical protein